MKVARLLSLGALAAVPVLAGCSGAVKGLNSAQVKAPTLTVANAFGLNNQSTAVAVGGAPTVQTYKFPNQPPINQADAQSATLSLSLAPTVTVTPPKGGTLPATFTLNSLTLTAEADKLDANGNVVNKVTLSPLTTGGPLTFTQTSGGTYTTTGTFQLQQATPTSGADVQTLVSIVTAGNSSNQVVLSLSPNATGLPAGTTLNLTVSSNQITVKTGS